MTFNIRGFGNLEERNFEKLYQILDIANKHNITVCAIQETHRESKSGINMQTIIRQYNPNYIYIEKVRVKNSLWKKAWGGTAFIVNKQFAKVIKDQQNEIDGILSIHIQTNYNDEIFIIHNVYIPPGASGYNCRHEINNVLITQLQQEQQHCQIIMGDFNARIGNLNFVINDDIDNSVRDNTVHTFDRESLDHHIDANGRNLVQLLQANNMIILNGLTKHSNNVAQYSRIGINSRTKQVYQSLIDYIAISYKHIDKFSADDHVCIEADLELLLDSDHKAMFVQLTLQQSNRTINENAQCEHQQSQSQSKSRKKRRKGKTCSTTERVNEILTQKVLFNVDDNYDEQYWLPFQDELDKSLLAWRENIDLDNSPNIQTIYSSFCEKIYDAAAATIGARTINKSNSERRERTAANATYIYSKEIAELKKEKRETVKTQIHSSVQNNISERNEAIIRIHQLKNQIKSKVRILKYERKCKLLKEIEELKSTKQKHYWNKLKQLVNWTGDKQQLPEKVKDNNNRLVDGEQAIEQWKQQYEQIGVENINDDKFDKEFAQSVINNMNIIRRENDEFIENESYMNSNHHSSCELNSDISIQEVTDAIEVLKRDKASGVDNIPNELLKFGGNSLLLSLQLLFQYSSVSSQIPSEWRIGIISPIPKPDELDKESTNSYRPITLLSCIGKVYSIILNNRLMNYCEKNNILSEEQNGFRPDRSCVDNIYTLSELIETRNAEKMKTFLCFIDLKKAYDVVFREGLWKKLYECGIKGRILNTLMNLYKETKSAVKVNNQYSEFFYITRGVRQGCVLSPLLFSIFIDGLVKEIKKLNEGINIDHMNLSLLLYADDIVLISDNAEKLQLMLNTIHEYSYKWRFEINMKQDKTAIMMFKCDQKDRQFQFTIGNNVVSISNHYCYLGVELSSPWSWTTMRDRCALKARKNMYIVWGMGIKAGIASVATSETVYRALVRSQLEYAAQVWGAVTNEWKAGEQVQAEMGKLILHCPTNTNAEVIRGELGWESIRDRHRLLRMRWWAKLVSMKQSRWPFIVYQYARNKYLQSLDQCIYLQDKHTVNWCSNTHTCMINMGIHRYWDNDQIESECRKMFISMLEKQLQESQQVDWRTSIRDKPKLRSYRLIKEDLCREQYLDNSMNNMNRVNYKSKLNKQLLIGTYIMTMLRSGTNELSIETDRRNCIPINKRVCRYCKANEIVIDKNQLKLFNLPCNRKTNNDHSNNNNYRAHGDANIYANVGLNCTPIEDEFHFLLDCPAYAEQRQLLYEQILSITNKQLDLYSINSRVQRMKVILGNANIYKQLNIYLRKEIIMNIIDKCKLFCFHSMKVRNNFNYKNILKQNNVNNVKKQIEYNNDNNNDNDDVSDNNDSNVINDSDIEINEYMNEIENIIC